MQRPALRETLHSPFMVVQVPDGKVWNPIAKAFKQLANGSEDSLEYFYQVATEV